PVPNVGPGAWTFTAQIANAGNPGNRNGGARSASVGIVPRATGAPPFVSAGSLATTQGTGFAPGEMVDVCWDWNVLGRTGTQVATVQAGTTGAFPASSYPVPAGAVAG